jgi:hypothetical protein
VCDACREWRQQTHTAPDRGFRAIEGKKKLGNALLWGGGVVASVGAFALSNVQSSAANAPLVLGRVMAMVIGRHAKSSADDPGAIDLAAKSLTIGQTRSPEVQNCLGKPSTMTTRNTAEEVWTYNVSRSTSTGGALGMLTPIPQKASGEMRSVSLKFKNGILSDITKTSAGF